MGRQKQRVVRLSDENRQQPTDMTRARLLLRNDQGLLDRDVAERQGVSAATVASIRRKYAQGGLYEKARPKQSPKLGARGA